MKLIKIGKIVNTHGFRGDVKAQSWCDDPEVITELKVIYRKIKNEFTEVKVTKASVHKDMDQRLPMINHTLAKQVRAVLSYNKAVRHLRGGDATRRKYQQENRP